MAREPYLHLPCLWFQSPNLYNSRLYISTPGPLSLPWKCSGPPQHTRRVKFRTTDQEGGFSLTLPYPTSTYHLPQGCLPKVPGQLWERSTHSLRPATSSSSALATTQLRVHPENVPFYSICKEVDSSQKKKVFIKPREPRPPKSETQDQLSQGPPRLTVLSLGRVPARSLLRKGHSELGARLPQG